MEVEVGERAVLERVRLVAGLLQIPVVEGVRVDDQRAALREVADIDLQCCGIHRDQHVRLIAGGLDVRAGEVELETAHAGQTAGRSANFGRKVGQRRDVVADDC